METDTKERNCDYCGLKCKNQVGLKKHLHLKHSIEKTTDLSCWTCGKLFSQEQLLNQHYNTVLHQINCKNVQKEKNEKPSTIEEIIQNHKEDKEKKQAEKKRPFKSRLYERRIPGIQQKRRKRNPVSTKYLRKDPAIIPTENTCPQADPQSEPLMTWLDLTLEEENFKESSESTDVLEHPTTASTSQISPLEAAFIQEIGELFDIPKEQIPKTSKTEEFLIDLPRDLQTQCYTLLENTSFLDLLMN